LVNEGVNGEEKKGGEKKKKNGIADVTVLTLASPI
jgi:hypothetical protein